MIIRKIKTTAAEIHINNGVFNSAIEKKHVFEFKESVPVLRVFENEQLKRTFVIDTLDENPDLRGQFLHTTIRVLKNGAVMIDGIISKDYRDHTDSHLIHHEAIRFQPFFLSSNDKENYKLKGKGLFERGLHFPGTVSPTNLRTVCICDDCSKSFTLQHFHTGFSQSEYFYSTDSQQTLNVVSHEFSDKLYQLKKSISMDSIRAIESQLPKPTYASGSYRYFNPYKCPHCQAVFIDFKNDFELRSNEYYGYRLINRETQGMD